MQVLRFDVSLELLLESGMGQLKQFFSDSLSRLMYRDFSLFISCTLLYITNILYTLFYFRCLFVVIASALISLIFIYLLSDVFIVMLSYISFPNGTSHRVDVLTQDRCVGIPYLNLLYHLYFRHVASRSKPSHGWSLLTSLILRLGRRHF